MFEPSLYDQDQMKLGIEKLQALMTGVPRIVLQNSVINQKKIKAKKSKQYTMHKRRKRLQPEILNDIKEQDLKR